MPVQSDGEAQTLTTFPYCD